MDETNFAATRRQHHEGEGGTALPALEGSVALDRPRFDGQSTVDTWAGWGADGATVTAADQLTIGYALVGPKVLVRAGFGGADQASNVVAAAPALPVYADPVTAAAATNGTLAVTVNNGQPIAARIVGVLPRFPATGPRFLVADGRALADTLDAREPGTGAVSELWRRGDPAPLRAAPFDLLRVDDRQAREDRLAADPLARGATGLLTSSALLSFVVALLALVLLVIAERRDESAQLYAWESDGVSPGTLRRSLFLRALAVIAIGVPGGIAIGLLLSRITTALVRVTAARRRSRAAPGPVRDSLWTVVSLAGGVVLGLAVCAGMAGASLRERLLRRPEEGLA